MLRLISRILDRIVDIFHINSIRLWRMPYKKHFCPQRYNAYGIKIVLTFADRCRQSIPAPSRAFEQVIETRLPDAAGSISVFA